MNMGLAQSLNAIQADISVTRPLSGRRLRIHDQDYWKIVFDTSQHRLGAKVLTRPFDLDERIRK